MATLTRHHSNNHMSQIVTHGDMIYLAGQVSAPSASVTDQTQAILEQIDDLLADVKSDKEHILQAIIWLASMDDFAEMNAVWDSWVAPGHAPARACGGARLATPRHTTKSRLLSRQSAADFSPARHRDMLNQTGPSPTQP